MTAANATFHQRFEEFSETFDPSSCGKSHSNRIKSLIKDFKVCRKLAEESENRISFVKEIPR
jgi:hypothetical protein